MSGFGLTLPSSRQAVVIHLNYYICKILRLFFVIRTVGGYAEKLPLHRVFSRFFFPARAPPKEVIYVYIAVRKALEKPH